MAPGSEFGSWGVESLDTYTNQRREFQTCSVERSPRRRPASATVRVPYLPSHVRINQLRAKRRPRSAANYMRSTFAIDSALPPRATSSSTHQPQGQPGGRRFRGRASWQPGSPPPDAKYVLQEDAHQGRNGSFDVSPVPRPRQGFGVRMPTAGRKTVAIRGGGEGGSSGRAQTRSAGSDRRPSRRPASAPVRFFGRRPVSSPGCERTTGRESYDPHGGALPRRATKRRPGSAIRGNLNLPHQGTSHRYHLPDQRKDGSPLPPAGWGVRPTSASSTLAGPLEARCLEQASRTYEKIVVCRGNQGVVKGSVARHQKRQLEDQRQQDEGVGGRSNRGLGSLEGAGEGYWAYSGRGEGGADKGGDQNTLGLAINPSPWGAFVGGPPAEKTTLGEKTALGRDRKRPSSAPRRPSTTAIPAPGLEVGSGRVQARPRSAHAASPSRNCASEVFVPYSSSCHKEDESRSKGIPSPAERAVQNSARRSSRCVRPAPAEDRVELGERTAGMDAGRLPEADGGRSFRSDCQQRASAQNADLVVIARQVQRGGTGNAGERIAIPKCWPSVASGAPSDTLSPSWLAQPSLPAPAPAPPPTEAASTRKVFGLFGSALLPAGSRTKLSRYWDHKRSAPQPRKQDRPRQQGRQQRTATPEEPTMKRVVERRTDGRCSPTIFAPVVLDRRIIIEGEENGRRHARAAGLAGKALRVPKHTNIQSQRQQAETPSLKREGQRPFSGLSPGQQPWLPGAQ